MKTQTLAAIEPDELQVLGLLGWDRPTFRCQGTADLPTAGHGINTNLGRYMPYDSYDDKLV